MQSGAVLSVGRLGKVIKAARHVEAGWSDDRSAALA
jgi:hypothetical protein